MTVELFREDAYQRECEATVVAVNDRGGIVLDQTVFYPTGGGQPGDVGILRADDGREISIATTVKGQGAEDIVHVAAEGQSPPAPGTKVTAVIDWDRRHRLMRMHTAMHLVCACASGGGGGPSRSRPSPLSRAPAGSAPRRPHGRCLPHPVP